MKTSTGDVIIRQQRGIELRMVAVVINDGDHPDDLRYWRQEGRVSAEEMARATVSNTGGRVYQWDGDGELVAVGIDHAF